VVRQDFDCAGLVGVQDVIDQVPDLAFGAPDISSSSIWLLVPSVPCASCRSVRNRRAGR